MGEDQVHAADIPSDIESASGEDKPGAALESEDEFFETADEKRVRLAKEYLGQLGYDKAPDQVQEQLVHDVDDKAGRVRLQIDEVSFGEMRYLKGHKQSATCLCLTSDERTVYSGGKDCAILRWDVETGKKDVF